MRVFFLMEINGKGKTDMLWFTSDHHFGHANCIKYCNRPFSSIEEMDQALIDRWNEIVGPKDTVWHLGDFTLGTWGIADKYLKQLQGNIQILGSLFHHDRRWIPNPGDRLKTKTGWLYVRQCVEAIEYDLAGYGPENCAIILCHYPFAVWDRKHYGSWHLHGHSHGKYKGEGKILDVGVDCHNFYPVSLEQVREIMDGK